MVIMTLEEIVDQIFADVTPEQTGDFATLLKQKLESSYSEENLKIIADQLETVGIIILGIPCKRTP
jgi:hypothetical protein